MESIAIEQKTIRSNPRSTVGTITEINNFLRLLFSKLGTPYCYKCDKPIRRQTVDEITAQIMAVEDGKKVFTSQKTICIGIIKMSSINSSESLHILNKSEKLPIILTDFPIIDQ